MNMHHPADRIIGVADEALRMLFGPPPRSSRPDPADSPEHRHSDNALSDQQKMESGRLMRVNHVGEICAQALYQSQALTAHDPDVREKLKVAAEEENDHLAWCNQRINNLGSHTSYLNPVWYAGAFAIGTVAGLAGDRWSLGFVAETEKQVVAHLESHLDRLPAEDRASRAVVKQMRDDEMRHATMATRAGAADLPAPVKKVMTLAARVMTGTAHWI